MNAVPSLLCTRQVLEINDLIPRKYLETTLFNMAVYVHIYLRSFL